jgi:hypothetical protein
MQVFFSTVIREAPVRQGGEFVRLDWESKTVLGRVPIFTTSPEVQDPNSRGNTRGGRGIEIIGDRVVVASYHTLKVYDRSLRHQRDVTHPLMVNLHETYSGPDGRIWISCTAIDAALEIDLETGHVTRQFWPREMRGFQRALGLTPLEIDKQADNRIRFLSRKYLEHLSHLHLNAVASWQGEMYALFHSFGIIVNLDRQKVVIESQALRGAHNLVIRDDGLAFVNDTFGRTIRIYDLRTESQSQVIDLMKFQWVHNVRGFARWRDIVYVMRQVLHKIQGRPSRPPRHLYVRGLDLVGNLLFVGLSPASILCIDWTQERFVDAYCYSKDIRACVHGLRVVGE